MAGAHLLLSIRGNTPRLAIIPATERPVDDRWPVIDRRVADKSPAIPWSIGSRSANGGWSR
jgi:hypothetical protein